MSIDEVEWSSTIKTRMFVLDFDKTITNKHTRGAVFHSAQLSPDELMKNFADLQFFRKVIPLMRQHAIVTVATFADNDEGALVSGHALVRKYLDIAFGEVQSRYLIPDECIEAWNPENRDMSSRAVGKNLHIAALRSRLAPRLKKRFITLIDDSERNCMLAVEDGYTAFFVKNAHGDDKAPDASGFNKQAWDQFLKTDFKSETKPGCVIS